MPLVSVRDAVAKIRAAGDAWQDPDSLIVARTEAIDRTRQDAESGADLIQPLSRSFKGYDDLVKLKEATGRRLSLQLMQGLWIAQLNHAQIEAVAAFTTHPIVTLMRTGHALQANLQLRSASSITTL